MGGTDVAACDLCDLCGFPGSQALSIAGRFSWQPPTLIGARHVTGDGACALFLVRTRCSASEQAPVRSKHLSSGHDVPWRQEGWARPTEQGVGRHDHWHERWDERCRESCPHARNVLLPYPCCDAPRRPSKGVVGGAGTRTVRPCSGRNHTLVGSNTRYLEVSWSVTYVSMHTCAAE